MADKETPKAADDRNLVNVDETYPHPSDEEKLALLWKKNKGIVFAAIGIFVIGLIGLQGVDAMRTGAIAAEQEAYLDAAANESLEAFAADNKGSKLGGAAALSVADEAYADGEYVEATSLYKLAAESLEGTVFAGRAKLGVGFAQAKSGDAAAASATWSSLATDADLSEAVRAEASYALAVAALEAGDDSAFEAAVARLEGFATSLEFMNRLRAIAPSKL